MRRLALASAFVAAAAFCAAVAAGNPHSEQVRLTRAGNRLARLAVLRQGDLPDWTPSRSPSYDLSLTCPTFDPDLSALSIIGEAGTWFHGPAFAEIASNAAAFPSRGQAVADFGASAKPQLAGCLRYFVNKGFRAWKGPVRAAVVSARMVRAPSLGARSAAYRLVSKVRVSNLVFTVYSDELVIQRGRTIAALVFTGFGRPVPSQAYYGGLVASRMR